MHLCAFIMLLLTCGQNSDGIHADGWLYMVRQYQITHACLSLIKCKSYTKQHLFNFAHDWFATLQHSLDQLETSQSGVLMFQKPIQFAQCKRDYVVVTTNLYEQLKCAEIVMWVGREFLCSLVNFTNPLQTNLPLLRFMEVLEDEPVSALQMDIRWHAPSCYWHAISILNLLACSSMQISILNLS